MTSAPDPLADLRDIHLPDPVSLWPPAPGWWIAAGLALGLVAACIWLARRRRRSLRRAALGEIDALARSFRRAGDANALATGLSALLRRVALARFPRETVASLAGAEWVRFLQRSAGRPGPADDAVADLARAVYAGPSYRVAPEDGERWLASVRTWVRSNT